MAFFPKQFFFLNLRDEYIQEKREGQKNQEWELREHHRNQDVGPQALERGT